jgi:hypothetical protein
LRQSAVQNVSHRRSSSLATSHEALIPDLIPLFRERVAGFSSETPDVQLGLAGIFCACVKAHGRFRSQDFQFGAYLSEKVIRSIWGRYTNMTEQIGYRYFGVIQGDSVSHKCSLYYPHPALVEAYKDSIDTSDALNLVDIQGKKSLRRKPSLPISGVTSTGGRRRGRGQPAKYLPIRADDVAKLARSDVRPECEGSIYHLLAISKGASDPTQIPVRYIQHADTGGRLYESNHLQGITRHIRSVALAGHWDYDISNCHFSLIAQAVEPYGVEIPTIRKYLLNKKYYRQALQTTLQSVTSARVNPKHVKEAIISLAYGASLTYSPSLAELFEDSSVYNAFRQNSWVQQIAAELTKCRNAILSRYPLRGSRRQVTNAMGLRRSFPKGEDKKALSFVITGMEARILDAVLQRWGSEIVLCIHDGWVARTRIPIDEMELEILRMTKYRVRIEGGRIVPMTASECVGCARFAERLKAEPDQWFTSAESVVGKTKGLPGPTAPIGPPVSGTPAPSKGWADPKHPNASPLFDPDFRGSGLYVTSRPRWNVGPNFRGVTARGGRPRGSRNRATTSLVRTVDSASAEGIL